MSDGPDTLGDTAASPEESHRKFQEDGTSKLFPGITVLCHLRNTNTTQATLRTAMIKHLPHITHINKTEPPGPSHVELPKSSWHMTIYDTKVYDPATWTSDTETNPQAARDADLATYHSKFSAIKADLRYLLPIHMKVDASATRRPKNGDPLVVPVIPYDYKEAEKLRRIREMIARAFDQCVSRRNSYEFHISTHYQLRQMGNGDFEQLKEGWVAGIEKIAEEVREGGGFEIDAIELCSFDSMFQFDVVDSVGGNGEVNSHFQTV